MVRCKKKSLRLAQTEALLWNRINLLCPSRISVWAQAPRVSSSEAQRRARPCLDQSRRSRGAGSPAPAVAPDSGCAADEVLRPSRPWLHEDHSFPFEGPEGYETCLVVPVQSPCFTVPGPISI